MFLKITLGALALIVIMFQIAIVGVFGFLCLDQAIVYHSIKPIVIFVAFVVFAGLVFSGKLEELVIRANNKLVAEDF